MNIFNNKLEGVQSGLKKKGSIKDPSDSLLSLLLLYFHFLVAISALIYFFSATFATWWTYTRLLTEIYKIIETPSFASTTKYLLKLHHWRLFGSSIESTWLTVHLQKKIDAITKINKLYWVWTRFHLILYSLVLKHKTFCQALRDLRRHKRSRGQQKAITMKTPHIMTPIMNSLSVMPLNTFSDSEGSVKNANLNSAKHGVKTTSAKQPPTNNETHARIS